MALAIARQLSPASKRLSASACWCSVSLGLRPNLVPRLRAVARPSLVRFTIRWRSSAAMADKKALKKSSGPGAW
jgi:hypothetical protein